MGKLNPPVVSFTSFLKQNFKTSNKRASRCTQMHPCSAIMDCIFHQFLTNFPLNLSFSCRDHFDSLSYFFIYLLVLCYDPDSWLPIPSLSHQRHFHPLPGTTTARWCTSQARTTWRCTRRTAPPASEWWTWAPSTPGTTPARQRTPPLPPSLSTCSEVR